MFIFIRGIPGSGKSTISNKLGEKTGCKVIHVDDFKKELMTQNPKALFIKEVVPYSYKKTIEVLENYKKDNLILEEIFRNKDFVQQILDFCNVHKIRYQWFNIVRDISKVLEINESRDRKVKNTSATLESMRQQISDIKISGEIVIENDDFEECILEIVKNINLK